MQVFRAVLRSMIGLDMKSAAVDVDAMLLLLVLALTKSLVDAILEEVDKKNKTEYWVCAQGNTGCVSDVGRCTRSSLYSTRRHLECIMSAGVQTAAHECCV